MLTKIILTGIVLTSLQTLASANHSMDIPAESNYWMKIKALNKFERTRISNLGIAIDYVGDDYVIAYGSNKDLSAVKKIAHVQASSELHFEQQFRSNLNKKFNTSTDSQFPSGDEAFHTYTEMLTELQTMANENSDLMTLNSLAKTPNGYDIWAVRISKDLSSADQKPGVIFMGGHHAREHLSVELPILFIKHLLTEYKNGNTRIVSLIDSRDIHIIPMVNPDGAMYDITGGNYKMWRKNRKSNGDGQYGVDLNRNYGYMWGTGGSSSQTSNETYKGPSAFSEVESTTIKNYIESHLNITILLSLHTYSKLILYPWGHKYDAIDIANDFAVHEKMAKKMATWNGYAPKQSSDLYIASGDTTDWSYGVHKIISFTFELDPGSGFAGMLAGGFYPGAKVIQPVFKKNIEPFLYLIDHCDNPYRVLSE